MTKSLWRPYTAHPTLLRHRCRCPRHDRRYRLNPAGEAGQALQHLLAAPCEQAQIRVGQSFLRTTGVLDEDRSIPWPVPLCSETIVDEDFVPRAVQALRDVFQEGQGSVSVAGSPDHDVELQRFVGVEAVMQQPQYPTGSFPDQMGYRAGG